MKVVMVFNGDFSGFVYNMEFLYNNTFFTITLGKVLNCRKVNEKTIIEFDAEISDRNIDKYFFEVAKLISVSCVGLNKGVDLTDVHIYEKREKYEIYIIDKESIKEAIIDKSKEGVWHER